jgi:hypothetical protein
MAITPKASGEDNLYHVPKRRGRRLAFALLPFLIVISGTICVSHATVSSPPAARLQHVAHKNEPKTTRQNKIPLVDPSRASGRFFSLKRTLILAQCHMDSCEWLSIESSRFRGASSRGELYEVWSKSWDSINSADHKKARRNFLGRDNDFVFCSKTDPAWISEDKERKHWVAMMYGSLGEVGACCAYSVSYYWAVCHGAGGEINKDKLVKKFGYKEEYLDTERVLLQPVDALKW